ncbi:MAG: hypothetical protein K8R53_11350 [Bacteroidales bacterium]|nr:hypothetical protein [Bacteroidales bacterium]
MKAKFLITIFVSVLIISGCEKKRPTIHQQSIDSLKVVLKNTRNLLTEVDTAILRKIDKDILFKMDQIKNTRDFSAGEVDPVVVGYIMIRRPIVTFFRDFESNITAIGNYEEQFGNLEERWQKKTIEELELGQKVRKQEEDINNLEFKIKNDLKKLGEKLLAYDTLSPLINEMVDNVD